MILDEARRTLNDFAWNIPLPANIEDCIKAVDEHCRKYGWHDLRKNPNDFPSIGHTVIGVVNNDYCAVVYYTDGWFYSHATYLSELEDDSEVVAWSEIEPFDEVAE